MIDARLSRIRTWVVLISAIAAPSCGGGDSVPLSQLGARLLDVSCDVSVRCQQDADKASCMASHQPALDQLMASVAAGKTKYDGASAQACLDAFDSGQSIGSCSLTTELNPVPLTACDATFTGTLGTGASCLIDQECVSASCDKSNCTGVTTCCLGVCAPKVSPVGIGGDCSASPTSCVAGTYCKDAAGATPTCTAKIAAGQPCDSVNGTTQCAIGTICIFTEPPGATGICGKLPAEGQPCVPSGFGCDVVVDVCTTSATSALSTCTRRGAVGSPCDTDIQCLPYALCDATAGSCVARGGAGAVCATSVATSCLGSLACVGGACTLPPPVPACP